MDTAQIITQVIIALISTVATVVTTILVTKASLNKGSLGITSKLKARFTPKFRAYISLFFAVGMFLLTAISLYGLVSIPSLPTRLEVFLITFNFAGVLGFLFMTAGRFANLLNVLDAQRAERDKALLRGYEEEQMALLQPTIDKLRETLRTVDESRPELPADPPKKVDSHDSSS